MLFHTGGGHTMWASAGYVAELTGYRHLLFDHRGHGRSDRPTHVAAHRVDEYVADVLAVLDALRVERVVMLGYSDGASVAYALAAAHPERVAAVVGIGAFSSAPRSVAEQLARARQVRAVGFPSWLADAAAAEREPPPRWLMDNLARTATEMFALKVEAWADAPSDASYFADIEAPTLVVCGEDEHVDRTAATAAAGLRDGTVTVIPGCGHLGVFWRSDLTGPVVRGFVRDATSATRGGAG